MFTNLVSKCSTFIFSCVCIPVCLFQTVLGLLLYIPTSLPIFSSKTDSSSSMFLLWFAFLFPVSVYYFVLDWSIRLYLSFCLSTAFVFPLQRSQSFTQQLLDTTRGEKWCQHFCSKQHSLFFLKKCFIPFLSFSIFHKQHKFTNN